MLDVAGGDTNWPYNEPWSTPISSDGIGASDTMTDSPGLYSFTIGPLSATSYSLGYNFFTYMMYEPPGGQWVPSAYEYWEFQSADNAPWVGTPPGACSEIQSNLTDQFPLWQGNDLGNTGG